jgi:hypothetical protein
VLPSAGVPWGLADLAGGEAESLGDLGVFSPAALGGEDGERTITGSMLARSRKEWLFVGSRVSGRAGRKYPQTEILETIQSLPHCSACAIVEVPSFEAGHDPVFTVVIFTGGKTGVGEAAVIKEIFAAIEREMGKEFFPDRVQFFPLTPRRDSDGNVDQDWCCEQYLSGSLFRKSQEETYRYLAQLREYLV